jgi:cation diffusion facilitator family transporter
MTTTTGPTPAALRTAGISRVLWIILGLNLVVAAAKLFYGWRSGAIAITADGIHSLLDASSNVFGLLGLWVAARPPDANHPYGHRKYETVAALAIAFMLFMGCWEIIESVLQRLRDPRVPDVSVEGFVILGLTIAVNVTVVAYERHEGRRLQSELLLSDAAHTMSDVWASLLVVASFTASRFGIGWTDLVAAGIIVLLILRAGITILRTTVSTLSDEARLDPFEVERAAVDEPGVLEAHNVRSRGPADDIHLDLHVLVAPSTPLAEAHALGHRVEARLRARWPSVSDVVVHVEPALDSERAKERVGGGLRADG